MKKLSQQQRDFIEAYLKHFNATRAYQEAYGCKYTSAKANGCRLKKNPRIKRIITRRFNKQLREIFYS